MSGHAGEREWSANTYGAYSFVMLLISGCSFGLAIWLYPNRAALAGLTGFGVFTFGSFLRNVLVGLAVARKGDPAHG